MEKKLSIYTDPTTLMTRIEDTGVSPKVSNELKLILSSYSQDLAISDNVIILSWYSFKLALIDISRLLRKEKTNIIFDEFSTSLVNNYISDKNNLRKGIEAVSLSEREIDDLLANIGFDRKLTYEQKRDVGKLLKLKHGANFSVPGAGKTTTLLAVHSILKNLGKVDTLFVISPINAFISWEDETKAIFKEHNLKTLRLTAELIESPSELITGNYDLILVNYEKLRKNIASLIPFFEKKKVQLLLDESHRIKSGLNNISYSQIIQLSNLAYRRDILSGTPMPQSYLDLIPQFDFLWPAEKIITVPNVKASLDSAEVNTAIAGLYVRTTKQELGLKNPHIFVTRIKMGPIQAELYKLFRSETARLISQMDISNRKNFRRIGRSVVRLLQASTNPMLLGTTEDYEGDVLPIPVNTHVWELLEEFIRYEKSAKIEYLKNKINDYLSKSPENKVVIWSSFVRNIQLLERLFKDFNPVSIYGGVSSGSDEDERYREGRIKKFHEDITCRIIIANPQACGEGISLHKVCHYAIYLDRTFNAAHYLQSIDRIHRLGLDPSITTEIEILVSENTVDEVLIGRLSEKINAMGEILDDPYLKTLAYDPADILEIEEDGINKQDFEEIKNHVLADVQ